MSDFDIKILLAQAKDDPRFQKITTNGLRMGSTALSNDPIVSGVDGGNTPLLFNIASNVPGLFDVAIDIFIVLKEEITITVKITDILSTIHSKKLREVVKIQDILQFETTRAKKDVVATVSRFQLEQKKALRSLFKVSDNVEELSHESRFEAIQKAISVVKVSKLEKKELHRTPIGSHYPNYELANRLSEEYGTIGGFGRDIPGFPVAESHNYEWVATNYWNSRFSFAHPYYGTEEGVIQLQPVIHYGTNYPFWGPGTPNPSAVAGYLYWWMPGYQYGPFPGSGGFLSFGDTIFSEESPIPPMGGTNRAANLYFFDVKNGAQGPSSTGEGTPFDPSGTVEIIDAKTLPSSGLVSVRGGGELAELISQIISIIKANTLPVQKVKAISKTLAPKAKIVRNKLNINEFVIFFQEVNHKSENIEATDLYDDQLNKGLKEILKARNFVLAPRAVLNTEKVFSKSTNALKVTTEIPTQIIRQIIKVTKDVSLFDQEEADIISNLLINPSRFVLNTNRLLSKTETKLGLNKVPFSKLKTIDKPQLGPNKVRSDTSDIKEFLLGLAKARIQTDRVESISKRFSKVSKPLQNYLKENDFISLQPNVDIDNEATILNTVIAGKSRLIVERLFAISDIDILREFKPEVFGVLNDLRLTKIVTTPKHNDKVKVKNSIIPAKSEIKVDRIALVSRDRDKGGASDVFFTFRPRIINETAFYNDSIRLNAVNMVFPIQKVKARINTITSKSELFTDREFVQDKRHSFEVGKKLKEKILISSDSFERTVEKPIKTVGELKEFLLSRPASFRFNTERANVKDILEPLVFKKLIPEHEVSIKSFSPSKKTEKNDEGITEFLSSSEKGYVWMRDEEYTRGAYFLEPYVAAIPPGRSRQF